MALWEIKNVVIRGVTGTVPNHAVKTADFEVLTQEEADIFDNIRIAILVQITFVLLTFVMMPLNV